MGGSKGGGTTTQSSTTSIPPEVLARYNSVNARAEQAASQPFTPYGGEFVAPVNQTQQGGINNITNSNGTYQPYFDAATSNLNGGLAGSQPYYSTATGQVASGLAAGTAGNANATSSLTGGLGGADIYNTMAGGNYQTAYNGAQPYNGAATGLALAGTQAVNPGALNIGQYMSPYTQSVINSTLGYTDQKQAQDRNALTSNAILSGSYGGDRSGIARGVLQGQQDLARSNIVSGLYNQNYQQALAAGQQQQGVGLGAAQSNRAALQGGANQLLGIGNQGYTQGMGYGSANQGLGQQLYSQGLGASQQYGNIGQQGFSQGLGAANANLGIGGQLFNQGNTAAGTNAGLGTGLLGANLSQGQAQLGAGTVQQQTGQAQDTAVYNQFLQQQGYPFQVAQFLANIAEGTGALSGSTTTGNTTAPQPFFSDERLKENIKTIGHTKDGLKIIRFNYKGSPHTQIGLSAQDVEKKRPEAVGLAGGFKTVDYDRATRALGGAVANDNAGQGFAVGGMAYDPQTLSAILMAHQAMYPGANGASRVAGGTPGAQGIVPPASGSAPKSLQGAPLMKLPTAQPTGLKQTLGDINAGASAFKTGKDIYSGASDIYDWGRTKYDTASGLADASATTGGLSSSDYLDATGLPSAGDVPRARGGRIKRAAGGAMPYNGNGYIPETLYMPLDAARLRREQEDQVNKLPSEKSGSSGGGGGLGGLGSLFSMGKGMMGGLGGGGADSAGAAAGVSGAAADGTDYASLLADGASAVKRGGRIHRADGGGAQHDNQWMEIPGQVIGTGVGMFYGGPIGGMAGGKAGKNAGATIGDIVGGNWNGAGQDILSGITDGLKPALQGLGGGGGGMIPGMRRGGRAGYEEGGGVVEELPPFENVVPDNVIPFKQKEERALGAAELPKYEVPSGAREGFKMPPARSEGLGRAGMGESAENQHPPIRLASSLGENEVNQHPAAPPALDDLARENMATETRARLKPGLGENGENQNATGLATAPAPATALAAGAPAPSLPAPTNVSRAAVDRTAPVDFNALPAYINGAETDGTNFNNPKFPVAAGGPDGPGQFTRDTWRTFAAANPQYFQGKTPEQIDEMRKDFALSNAGTIWYAKQNAPLLEQAGIPVTKENLYLAHGQGAAGAIGLLRDPQRNSLEALTAVYGGDRQRALKVIADNGGTPDMTAGQFAATYSNRANRVPNGGGTQVAGTGQPGRSEQALKVQDPNARRGLGGADLSDPNRPMPPKDVKNGDWLDRNERPIVAGLTFLGNMLGSKSHQLVGSIGEGIAAAAPAYAAMGFKQQEAGLTQQGQTIQSRSLDIQQRAQYMTLLAQLRVMRNAQIGRKEGVDPALETQIKNLETLIAPPAGAPGAGSAPQAGSPYSAPAAVPTAPASAPAAPPVQPATGPGNVAQPPAAPPQGPLGANTPSPAPAINTPSTAPAVTPAMVAAHPALRDVPAAASDPAFLGKLHPDQNFADLYQRADEMVRQGDTTGMADKLVARADAAAAHLKEFGYGLGPHGETIMLPGWTETARSKQMVEANNGWSQKEAASANARQRVRNSLDLIAEALESYHSNAYGEVTAKAQSALRDLGLPVPEGAKWNDSMVQELKKQAANLAGGADTDLGKSLARAGTIDPTKQPEANKKILAQAYADLNAHDAQIKYLQPRITAVPQLDTPNEIQKWNADNPIKKFQDEAYRDLAIRGATPPANEMKPDHTYIIEPGDEAKYQLPPRSLTGPTKYKVTQRDGKYKLVPVQ